MGFCTDRNGGNRRNRRDWSDGHFDSGRNRWNRGHRWSNPNPGIAYATSDSRRDGWHRWNGRSNSNIDTYPGRYGHNEVRA